jgi:triosephosphate isomerase
MIMRKKIVAGNWKMNLNYAEAMALSDAVTESIHEDQKTCVILAPPLVFLHDVVNRVQNNSCIAVAAQNCSDKNSGAYTGEVSCPMLVSVGVDYVIIGHSERRSYFGEESGMLAEKINRALENSILPVYCCGETAAKRMTDNHFDVVKEQLEGGLFHLDMNQLEKCVIAYEPVWAIGTGVNATPEQAQEMHGFIRRLVEEKYGRATAQKISLLYGGSITPQNSRDLFSCEDIDGGLVGGASLKSVEFLKIVDEMEKLS